MRVGALPQYPSNALNYNLTWSTDGVINEYCEPCEAIVDGELVEVPPLEEREEFSLDGVTYEAFNTSGGLGTLAETLKGKVRTLNYRTIRYPGHAAIMKALLNDLGLRHRRDVLKDILENALPATLQDVVIVFVTVSGRKNGRLMQETYANKVYSQRVGRPGAQRHPDHHGIRHLRRARHAGRRQPAGDRLRPAGRHRARRLPRQPLRPRLCAARDGEPAGELSCLMLPPRRGRCRRSSTEGVDRCVKREPSYLSQGGRSGSNRPPSGCAGHLPLEEGDHPSNMQRVAERLQRRFLEAFALRRVGMDRAGDVLQPRAHLERQAEGRRQFRHALPDRLDAEHQMVVGARDDADEAVLAEHGHRAAVGREREHGRS